MAEPEQGEVSHSPYAPRPSVLPSFQPPMVLSAVRGVCSVCIMRESRGLGGRERSVGVDVGGKVCRRRGLLRMRGRD